MRFDNEYRINYYLGNASRPFKLKIPEDKKFKRHRLFNATKTNLINAIDSIDERTPVYYITDLLEIHKYLPVRYTEHPVAYFPGDNDGKLKRQCLTKTRLTGDGLGTILKVEKDRHFELLHTYNPNYKFGPQANTIEYLRSIDQPFHEKLSSVVYRGGLEPHQSKLEWFLNHPFGKARRYDLLHRYINNKRYNIAATGLGKCPSETKYTKLIKETLSLQQMLSYKYIVSVEGNDVSSGLKWMMLSNSVVMMPQPTTCSWFMEDHLEPFKHYVPLKNNFTDLDDKFEWCENNPDVCEQIALNATQYTTQFYDKMNEMRLNREVLKRYIDNAR